MAWIQIDSEIPGFHPYHCKKKSSISDKNPGPPICRKNLEARGMLVRGMAEGVLPMIPLTISSPFPLFAPVQILWLRRQPRCTAIRQNHAFPQRFFRAEARRRGENQAGRFLLVFICARRSLGTVLVAAGCAAFFCGRLISERKGLCPRITGPMHADGNSQRAGASTYPLPPLRAETLLNTFPHQVEICTSLDALRPGTNQRHRAIRRIQNRD